MGLLREVKQYISWAYVCASNSPRIDLSHKELFNPFGNTKLLM